MKKNDPFSQDFFICEFCGEKVKRGIVNASHHWLYCKKNTDGLIVARNEWERMMLDQWSLNVKDEK